MGVFGPNKNLSRSGNMHGKIFDKVALINLEVFGPNKNLLNSGKIYGKIPAKFAPINLAYWRCLVLTNTCQDHAISDARILPGLHTGFFLGGGGGGLYMSSK